MTGAGAGPIVRWTQVDGVNVAWADEPGPLRAQLIFRIGKADEHLRINGITHLIEHLALFPLGQQPHYQNGTVRTSLTSFETAGDPAEVSAFLAGVCTSLGDLPTDRLTLERRVVETEARRWSGGIRAAALIWRFGPNGPGLWGADEYAVQTADGHSLQTWADQVFTRENAVLVLSGPPSAGLSLPLPSRGRLAVPPLVDMLPRTPAWFEHSWPDVGVLALVPRGSAAAAYVHALRHELVDNLRFKLGVAYSPSVDYEPYDGSTAFVFGQTDAHRDHLEEVAQVVAGTVAALAERGPAPERVREFREALVARDSLPGASLAAALHEASDLLLSGTYTPISEVRARGEAMTDEDVAELARTAWKSLLYALPQGATLPVDRAVRAPRFSLEPPVAGHRFRLLGDARADDPSLVVGADGLTFDHGGERTSTVRFATCRLALAWPDGRRVLVSPEGISVTVEPTLWQSGRETVELIDRATAHVRVDQPPREDSAIPRPAVPVSSPVAVGTPPGRPRGADGDASQVTGQPTHEPVPTAAFAYDSNGRPVNQFGTPLDLADEPLWVDTTPTRGRRRAWRTVSPAPARWAAAIAGVYGLMALFGGVQGLRTMTTTGLPPGQARDGAAGPILAQTSLESLFHTALLLGGVAIAVALLTLVGVRAAGAVLLLAFTVSAGAQVVSLVTVGVDYLRMAGLFTISASIGGFLAMTSRSTLWWIRRG